LIITYFRSSSYNAWGLCPQQYFLAYLLGIPQKENKKAEMGTIVHKVLECLAHAKKAIQDNSLSFTDEVTGEVHIKEDMIYRDSFVEYLFDKSYRYYSERSPNTFDEKDRKKILEWTFKPLNTVNGAFDPRNRDIVQPEFHFDFEIDEPWAAYEYKMPDGTLLKGQLALKGTIDLVTKLDDGIYESIDWKTGQRLDWASNRPWPHNIKTFDKLIFDPQLRIYHYALHKYFADAQQFIPTICFINDHGTKSKPVPGGIFSMAYEKNDIPQTLDMIRKRFEVIKATSRPQLVRTWKCDRFCHFGMTPHKSGEIDPRTGQPYTICEYIARRVRNVGIDQVVREEKDELHTIGHYKPPGT